MNSKDFILSGTSLPDPELHFLASRDELFEYQNLYTFATWLKTELQNFDINDEAPLMLFTSSSDQLVFTIAACWLLQIPVLFLSPKMSDSELQNALQGISPSAAITDPENMERLGKIPSLILKKQNLTMSRAADLSVFSNTEPEKLLGYFLTSGTTGIPKIVPLKRRQLLSGSYASAKNFKPERNRYWLLCLPLNHVGGITIILRSILYQSAVFRMETFDTEQVFTFLSENKLFQAASMVPTMLNRLLRIPEFHVHIDFKAILLGGGPITPQLIEKSLERGLPIVTSYGMTETCAQIAANPLLKSHGTYYPRKSVGKIFEPNFVEIRNEEGKKMPVNEPGTIWLKGPQVFDGYLESKDNQGKFDGNGWFNTEDYGYLNRAGQLFILSRRSDLIITGGENIYPSEIEAVLNDIDSVRESAVFGASDSEWGQIIIACIIPAPDATPDTETILSYLKKKLSAFKIPKEFIYVNDLPRTESGKVNREKLIQLYASADR